MMIEWLDEMATITVAAFVNGLWLGVLLTGIVWTAIRLMSARKPINATTRFMVWATVLVLCAGMILWQGIKQVKVSYIKPVLLQEMPAAQEAASLAYVPQTSRSPVAPLQSSSEFPAAAAEMYETEGLIAIPDIEEVSAAVVAQTIERGSEPIEWSAIGPALRRLLFMIWIFGSIALLLRTGYGIFSIRRLKWRSQPASHALSQRLDLLTGEIRKPRRVRIGLSDDIDIAVATGLLNPMILIPATLPNTLTPEELDQVLLHEFAHLQRRDDWTILLQLILTNILFFHPAMYALGKLMEREREFACDDWVVALTHRPKAYASCLAKIVSLHQQARKQSLAPAIISRKKQLFERVGEILNRNRTVSFHASRRGYIVVLGLMMIVMLGAMRFAPVIALTEPMAQLPDETEPPVPPASRADEVIAAGPEVASESSVARMLEPVVVPEPVVQAEEQSAVEQRLAEVHLSQQLPVEQDEGAVTARTSLSVDLMNARPDRAIPLPVPVTTAQVEPVNLQVPRSQPASPVRRDSAISNASMVKLLRASQKIASSGDHAQLLMQAAEKLSSDEAVILAYLESVSTIASSGDRWRALDALLKYHTLGEQGAIAFLKVVRNIPSSGDKSRILIKSLDTRALPVEQQSVRDAFLKTLDAIPASSDYRRVSEYFVRLSIGQ